MGLVASSEGIALTDTYLYERLAEELAAAILDGRLPEGCRLPSVRLLCAQRNVSPATAFQTYAVLESRGLVEIRPRSGCYVSLRRRVRRPLMAPSVPRPGPQTVAVGELIFELLATAQDPAFVPLGSAFPSPELFPFDALARSGARAMRRVQGAQIMGGLVQGDPELREAVHARYALHGVPLDQGELTITNGAMEALSLCLQACTRPGDVVVVESPTFYAALQTIERLHLRALEVATDPQNGVDLDALAQLLEREKVAACWFMTSFQNPLGACMTDERKKALVDLLSRHQVPLIEDDVYAELYAGVQRPLPAKAFDQQGLVLHCSSFSKCLAPGYRVGWAAAGRYAREVQKLKMMSTLATSLPAQRALADYLSQGGYERHLRNLRQALAAQTLRAQRQIARYFPAETTMSRPRGGYFLWLELPPGADALTLHQQALTHGISIAPGGLFSADGRFTRHIRLNVGSVGDVRVDQALRALGGWVGAQCAGQGGIAAP